MKWLRFRHQEREGFGILAGEAVWVHADDMFASPTATGERVSVAEIEWLIPCLPSKIIAMWNNFFAVAAAKNRPIPTEAMYFHKGPNSYCAHKQPIKAPKWYGGRINHESELAIVIGTRAYCVSEADAPAHIFGYTVCNDVTAVDLILKDQNFQQWSRGKGMDTFGVFGPVIETEFDYRQAELRTVLNGRERQKYPLSDMIFSPAQLVSMISHDMTLEQGDVIMCGTSVGVVPMKPGVVIEITIDGIGTLVNEYKGPAD